jgi:hypothetical protein
VDIAVLRIFITQSQEYIASDLLPVISKAIPDEK